MIVNHFETGRSFAEKIDREDKLRHFRDKFFNPEENTIYLDGNSLGKLPLATRENLKHVIDRQWGTRLIRSWNEGWFTRSAESGKKLARIIGAGEDEVIIADSTSMNLYKLAYAALRYQRGRKKIVSDNLNFPTDVYILQGIVDQLGGGHELQLVHSWDGMTVSMKELEKAIDRDTALVVLSHVAFKSAFMYDMKAVTELAHRYGALILWDLSHAAGAVPVNLLESKADMAVGCTYKYLNGGPGAPAYLYLKKELQEKLISPLWGWFGDSDPFAFELNYKAASGIKKFLVGTPPVLSQEAIEPGLDLILQAGIDKLRQKSVHQSNYMIFLFEQYLLRLGFTLGSPADPARRGSHLSFQHPEAYRICKALIEPQKTAISIIPDFRAPDNIRVGITPLYTSYLDIWLAVERLLQIVENKEYESFTFDKGAVT